MTKSTNLRPLTARDISAARDIGDTKAQAELAKGKTGREACIAGMAAELAMLMGRR